jgi:hypothetical protein
VRSGVTEWCYSVTRSAWLANGCGRGSGRGRGRGASSSNHRRRASRFAAFIADVTDESGVRPCPCLHPVHRNWQLGGGGAATRAATGDDYDVLYPTTRYQLAAVSCIANSRTGYCALGDVLGTVIRDKASKRQYSTEYSRVLQFNRISDQPNKPYISHAVGSPQSKRDERDKQQSESESRAKQQSLSYIHTK